MNLVKGQRERRKIKAQLDMTPIIDVVLQLIIFFMLSSTFVVQSSIQIEMPEAEGAATIEHKDVAITLTNDSSAPDGMGRIYFDDEEMTDWAALSDRLSQEKATREDEFMVLIRTDEHVESGRMIKLMGVIRSLGIAKMGVAALSPEQE